LIYKHGIKYGCSAFIRAGDNAAQGQFTFEIDLKLATSCKERHIVQFRAKLVSNDTLDNTQKEAHHVFDHHRSDATWLNGSQCCLSMRVKAAAYAAANLSTKDMRWPGTRNTWGYTRRYSRSMDAAAL